MLPDFKTCKATVTKTLYRRQWSRPSPRKRCQKATWLSEEVLQVAEKRRDAKGKGEKERYTHLNAEFQTIARRGKTALLSEQRKETENNRTGKTRGLFENIRDTKGTFHAKMGSIKDRNGMDLTEAADIKKRWQEYTEELLDTGLILRCAGKVEKAFQTKQVNRPSCRDQEGRRGSDEVVIKFYLLWFMGWEIGLHGILTSG